MTITAEANAARFTAHYANPDTRTVLRTVGDLLLCKHVARDGDVVVVDPIRGLAASAVFHDCVTMCAAHGFYRPAFDANGHLTLGGEPAILCGF